MSQQYRLVFTAELVAGQHAAVVQKRLAKVLKLDAERMDILFSGKSVILKKATDAKTAARYQQAFEKVGAVLRVLPLDVTDGASGTATEPAASGSLDVLPLGADILTNDERAAVAPANVDTSHLSLQGAVFSVDDPAALPETPNVAHLTLLELGVALGAQKGEGDTPEAVVLEINTDFDLAETGVDLDTSQKKPPPPPPDTTHLALDDSE